MFPSKYLQQMKQNTKEDKTQINKRNNNTAQKKLNVCAEDLPASADPQYNKTTDCIRAFELEQMSYNFGFCSIWGERILEIKMAADNVCVRCCRIICQNVFC